VSGHHGESFGCVDDGWNIGILTVKDRLVECLLLFREYMGGNVIGDPVDEPGFISGEKIDRFIILLLYLR